MKKLSVCVLLFALGLFYPQANAGTNMDEFQAHFLPIFYRQCGADCADLRRIGCSMDSKDPFCVSGECNLEQVQCKCLQWFITLPGKGEQRPILVLVHNFSDIYILVHVHGHLVLIGSQSILVEYDEEVVSNLAKKTAETIKNTPCYSKQ